jgi:hypothetical protein
LPRASGNERKGESEAINDTDALEKVIEELIEGEKGDYKKCGKVRRDGGTVLKRCSRCHNARYCAAYSQKVDWKEHKKVCAQD